MRRRGFLLMSAGAMLIILAGPATVRGQEVISGVVNAMSFHSMPEGMPILVRPLDDSPENIFIKAQLEDALTNSGFNVAAGNSSLVLSFETRRELGGGPTPQRPVTQRFIERHQESDIGDRRYKPQIGKGSPQGPAAISASRFRLDATLDDRQGGKRLWQGWTIARMKGDETRNLATAMAPVLVDSLGKTVRQQTFDIPVGTASDTPAR